MAWALEQSQSPTGPTYYYPITEVILRVNGYALAE